MKRIAFYFESTRTAGGVNRVVSVIAGELARRGWNVHLISRYEGRGGLFLDEGRGVTFHELFRRFHSKYLTAPVEAARLRRLVKREGIEVVVSAGGMFFALARFSPARHIVWDHTGFHYGDPVRRYLRRVAARHAESLVTLTDESRRAYTELPRARAHLVVIHNPAPRGPGTVGGVRSKTIITLGRLEPQKGYDLLIEAWAMVDPAIRNEWQVLIAGKDDGEGPRLEKMIEQRGIDNIRLLGFRTDTARLLARSSIYVLSSRGEGMPMGLLEAQAWGLPIVSFDCPTGPAEILTPECGILVESENTAQLAAALETLMKDSALRERFSAAALENVKRFSVEGIVEQWIELFER